MDILFGADLWFGIGIARRWTILYTENGKRSKATVIGRSLVWIARCLLGICVAECITHRVKKYLDSLLGRTLVSCQTLLDLPSRRAIICASRF